MKLMNLKVSGIRGFNLEKEINLDEGLTVIYGPNGQGKTSFVEAIEWLIYGTIYKKDKAPSKIEYRETIRNANFPGDGVPHVECVFQKGDELIKLRREYIDEDQSNLFINDTPSESIREKGISDTIRPIIYQHGLKSFIHTEPKDRFLEFMKLLNIDEVDTFLRRIRDAQKEYKKNKPKKIRNALLFLKDIEEELPRYYRILINNNFDILKLSDKINEELKIFDDEITGENLKSFKEAVRSFAIKTRRELFDIEIFSPILSSRKLKPDFLDKPEIMESIELLANPDIALAKSRLDVLRNGLKIIETTEAAVCPLCFEKTIDKGKVEFIKSKFREDNAFEKDIKKAQKTIRAYLTGISQFKTNSLSSVEKLLLDEAKIKLCKNFGVGSTLIGGFTQKNNTLDDEYKETTANIESLEKMTEDVLNGNIQEGENIIDNLRETLDNLKNNFKNLNQIINELSTRSSGLKTVLEKKISSSDRVKRIDKLYNLLKNSKDFRILQIDAEIENTINNSIQAVKSYRDRLLNRMLSSHKTNIIDWNDILNPNEDVRICDIDCNKDKVNFIVNTYGVKKQAVPILSEAHLNCLGLSIFLSKIVIPDNPFSFILIDDPVQSMDETHTDNFINEVIEKLIKKNLQVFVFTHMAANVSNLILKRYKEFSPTYLEFYGCNIEGPRIKKKGNTFEEYISTADQNYMGDLEQRKTAANMIRQALETYAKEYYCKKSGEELPGKYRAAQFSVLDEKLLSKVAIDGNERGKLRMINIKCDKRSHDDQVFEPPSSPELRSHIDTLKGLYRKHIRGIS